MREKTYRVSDVADELGISRTMAYKLIDLKQLRAFDLGTADRSGHVLRHKYIVYQSDLEAFKASRATT